MTEAMVAVSKQLNVSRESVRRIDAGRREGTTTQESEEIKKLRAENRRLREDVAENGDDFFAGGNRPPQPLIMGIIDTMRS